MINQIPNPGHPIDNTGNLVDRVWYLFFKALNTALTATGVVSPGQIVVGGATPGSIAGGNLSGDVSTSGSTVTTLATVNSNVGTFGDSTHVSRVTLDGKGRVTAASSVAIASSGDVTHTGTLTSGTLIQGNGGADITLNATTATVTKLTAGVPSAATAGTDYTALAFKTIAVSGQSDVVADTAADTLTFAAGTNITLTTNAGTDTVTITAAGSGTVTTTGSPVSGNLTKFSGATSITNADLTGDVTTAGTVAATIANSAVTYAKMQNVSANSTLIGSSATGSGAPPSEIALGSGLSMAGSTLSATGTGGTVTTTGSPASGNLTKFSGASSITNGDLSGDATTTGTLVLTLATVNSNVATWGNSTNVGQFTVNAKGLITAAGNVPITVGGIGGATLDEAYFFGVSLS